MHQRRCGLGHRSGLGSCHVPTAGPYAGAVIARLTALPRTLQVLAVWAAASALSLLILRAGAADTPATPWADAAPSYLEHLSFWDSGWYDRILTEGYPASLPVDSSGSVTQNAWAFMPLLPSLAWVLGWTGLDFYAAATAVSVAASAGAAVLMDRWLSTRVSPSTSLWPVALVWTCPVAPIMQVPYAEALGLALLAATLLVVERGRYLLAGLLVLLTCFTRPLGLPLAGALLAFWAWQELVARSLMPAWMARLLPDDGAARVGPFSRAEQAGRAGRNQPASEEDRPAGHGGQTGHMTAAPEIGRPAAGGRDRRRLLILAVWACLAAFLWPAAAWLVTGRMDAYTATETAWRGGSLAPLVPWAQRAAYFGGAHAGWVLLAGIAALIILVLSSSRLRRLGPLTWWWCVAYTAYLLIFFDPTTSLLRLALPLAPAVWALAGSVSSRRAQWTLVALGVVGQVLWVAWVWDLGSVSITWVP